MRKEDPNGHLVAYPDRVKGLARTIVALVLLSPIVTPAAAQPPVVLPVPREIDGSPVLGVLAPDAIRAIDDPTFLRGAAAARQMVEDESVLGVRLGGGTRAYPLGFLTAHEIVNDHFGDIPVAVTW